MRVKRTTGTANVEVTSDPMLRAELSPAGDGLMLRLVVAPLGPQGPRLMPGRGRARVMTAIGGESIGAERDLATEQAHLETVLATRQGGACELAGRQKNAGQRALRTRLVSCRGQRHAGRGAAVCGPNCAPTRKMV